MASKTGAQLDTMFEKTKYLFDHRMDDSDDFVMVASNTRHKQLSDDIPVPFQLQLCQGLDLREVTVDELQHHYSRGDLDAYTYTKYCLENIRKVCVLETYI